MDAMMQPPTRPTSGRAALCPACGHAVYVTSNVNLVSCAQCGTVIPVRERDPRTLPTTRASLAYDTPAMRETTDLTRGYVAKDAGQ